MKLLVDMNLSPSWVERLARHGFEAVHWSTIGAATAPDVEILTWANEHEFVLITNDLDFSAILAAGAVDGPSVVQIRTQDLLSDGAVRIVARALEAHREDIERGALLSIDEGGTRVRMLPLQRLAGSLVARNPDCHRRPLSPSLVADRWTSNDENRVGEHRLGSMCSPCSARGSLVETRGAHDRVQDFKRLARCLLPVSDFAALHAGGALCRPCRSRARLSQQ